MGLEEQMKEFEKQKRYVKAEFDDKELKLEVNATFADTLSLAMALFEQAMKRDSGTTTKAITMFMVEQLGKEREDD